MNKKGVLVVFVIFFILFYVHTGDCPRLPNLSWRQEQFGNRMTYAGNVIQYIVDPREPDFRAISADGDILKVPDAQGYLMRPAIDSGFLF